MSADRNGKVRVFATLDEAESSAMEVTNAAIALGNKNRLAFGVVLMGALHSESEGAALTGNWFGMADALGENEDRLVDALRELVAEAEAMLAERRAAATRAESLGPRLATDTTPNSRAVTPAGAQSRPGRSEEIRADDERARGRAGGAAGCGQHALGAS